MAKKKKVKKSSSYTAMLKVLAQIKNPIRAISYLKKEYPRNITEVNFSKLVKIPHYREHLLGTGFPKVYKKLETTKYTYIGDLDTEIWWTVQMLKVYKKDINNFLKKSEEYSKLLLYGEYDLAEFALEKIEEDFGVSTWLIENKIVLYSKMYGLTKQKEYLRSIRDDLIALTPVLAYFYSQRSESEFSYEQFNKEFNLFWSGFTEMINYATFKCTTLINKIENPAFVLYEESTRTAIDRYLTLKKLFFVLLTNLDSYPIKEEEIKNHLVQLLSIMEDYELLPLGYSLDLVSCEILNSNQEQYVEALDLYTIGNYKDAYELCRLLIENKVSDCFSVLELMIKSELRCGDDECTIVAIANDSILWEIYVHMKNITIRNESMNISLNKLLKISMELPSFILSSRILFFIKKELPYSKSTISEQVLNISKRASCFYDIRNINIFSGNKRKSILECYNSLYPSSLTYKFYNNPESTLSTNLPDYRRDKYIIKSNNNNISFQEKISLLKKLIDTAHILDKFQAYSELIRIYLELKEIEQCVEIVVEAYLWNKNIIYSIDINDLMEVVQKEYEFDFTDNISIPIFYDIYCKHISSKLTVERAIRYEMFLESCGYEKPRDLIKNNQSFSVVKVDYFLQYLSVMQVMDTSIYFLTTKEIENERIFICQYLSEKYADTKEVYSSEIKKITETSLISDSLKELEQNKIYVNTDGIKNHLEPVLKEYYLRYRALQDNIGEITTNEIYRSILRNQGIITIPNDDITQLLHNALMEVRDYFVLSSQYGLNGYLSTSIRHGSLLNFIRSSLNTNNIVPISNSNIEEALMIFTKNIDNIIYRLTDIYIQVNTSKKDNDALFNYVLREADSARLRHNMRKDLTYDEFVNSFFDYLWERTDINLYLIREKIQHEITSELSQIFTDLSTTIESIKCEENFSGLRDLIALESTKMQTKLETILSWFTRKTISDIKDFDFSLPVNIAQSMVENVNINANIQIEKAIHNKDLFKGNNLKAFVDILYIVFDNAVYHNADRDVNITLSFQNSNKKQYTYKLEVLNSTKKDIDIPFVEKELDLIKQMIRDKLYGNKVSSEGGTGFFKIAKILSYDLQLHPYYMDFGFTEDDQFYVKVEFN